jgi:hypothetical protein
MEIGWSFQQPGSPGRFFSVTLAVVRVIAAGILPPPFLVLSWI